MPSAPQRTDLAIVGAGILGLAHAALAARAGKSVAVFEKTPHACAASVRNFGMIWPIGQPAGPLLNLALRSRELWLEFLAAANFSYRDTGSLHLTYRDDEAAVAQEFAALAPSLGYDCTWLTPAQTLQRSQAVQPQNLLGALWSPTEFTVDPRRILHSLPAFLAEQYGVQFHFTSLVTSITPGPSPTLHVTGPDGQPFTHHAQTVLVCGGEDFQTLYPAHYAAHGITRCKLQMMRTAPQPGNWQLGPSLAAGLTLRFYPAFQVCSTLPALARRIVQETPELDQHGIHCLVSQTADGALTLGDSHHYGLDIDPFNRQDIDDLILAATRQFLRAPDLTLAERWYGVYARHPTQTIVTIDPEPHVRIVVSPGGSGMTLSFGLAEQTLKQLGILHA
jgi:FAD dependent oxidoreductase TIGR03364